MDFDDVKTINHYYLELLDDQYGDHSKKKLEDFVAIFFPHGVPTFDVTIHDEKYYAINLDGKMVDTKYSYPNGPTEEGCVVLAGKINGKEEEGVVMT